MRKTSALTPCSCFASDFDSCPFATIVFQLCLVQIRDVITARVLGLLQLDGLCFFMYIPVCIVHGYIVSSPFYSNRVLASCSCFSLFWFSPFFILLCFPTLPPDTFFSREDNFPVRLRLLPPCLARSALSSQRQCFPCVHWWDGQRLVPPVSAKHLLRHCLFLLLQFSTSLRSCHVIPCSRFCSDTGRVLQLEMQIT